MDETKPRHVPSEPDLTETPDRSVSKVDLRPFADQLMAIAEQLRSWELSSGQSRNASGDERQSTPSDHTSQSDRMQQRQSYADMARKAYAIRRGRAAIFGNPELFGEPAWDILLDLYIAFADGKPVSVSSACIGSASPPTTGLRWLGVLADHDLILREHDPNDQRRVLVRLTDKGIEAMEAYFATAIKSGVDA